jgi:choline monooxygenase
MPIRCESWANLVFVNFAGDGPDLLTFLAPLRERWKAYDFSKLRLGGSATFELKANWKLAVENFSEAYHLPWVHPGLNSYSPLEDHDCFFIPGFCQGQLSRNYAPTPVNGRIMPRFEGMTPEQLSLGEYPVIFPNLMLGVHADHFFALSALPLAPGLTYERFDVFVVGDEATGPAYEANRAAMVEGWRRINVEDMDVVERMQIGRTSPAMDGGRFAPGQDDCVHAFDLQWAAAMLGDGGDRFVRAAD